eukprot:scaffold8374_cov175-Amphora_coffeaeformis.AAC.92
MMMVLGRAVFDFPQNPCSAQVGQRGCRRCFCDGSSSCHRQLEFVIRSLTDCQLFHESGWKISSQERTDVRRDVLRLLRFLVNRRSTERRISTNRKRYLSPA